MKPLFEFVTPIPFVALQQMFNKSAEWGSLAYEKALYLDRLSDAAIATIGEHAPKKKSPLSFSRRSPWAASIGRTPTPTRRSEAVAPRATCSTSRLIVRRERPDSSTKPIGAGYATSGTRCVRTRPARAATSTFMADADENRVKAAYGPEKYARLAWIKKQWDPDNTFHLNVNIKPA